MKKITAIVMAGILTGSPVFSLASESMLEIEEKCRSYAVEDNILQAEMENYLQECIETLSIPTEEEGENMDSESHSEKTE